MSRKMASVSLSSLFDSVLPVIAADASLLRSVLDRGNLLSLAKHFIAVALSCVYLLLSLLLASVHPPLKRQKPSPSPVHDTAAGRALSHVFSVIAAVPTSSRKYECVRSLADHLVADNLRHGSASVNHAALLAAFDSTAALLEAELAAGRPVLFGLSRRILTGGVRILKEKQGAVEFGSRSAEKLAAEMLWLAQGLVECGAAEEAVSRWSSATRLGQLAISADTRLQAALLRVSVVLFKQAEDLEEEDEAEASKGKQGKKMKLLMTWLPLLCRATNGVDMPVMSIVEKAEMVTLLEKMIEGLNLHQQEKVLALWLDNFMSNPDSDWPNLQACYSRWYNQSRKLLPV